MAAAAEEDASRQEISLDLVDADLRDAIALIFKDTPLNHVIADGVYGTGVTLKLDGITRERALDILLKSKGLQYSKEGGVYMIKPKPGANPAGGMLAPGGGAPGMMPGMPGEAMPGAPAMPGQPAAADAALPGAPGTAGGAAARNSTLHQIKLTHLDPWYLYAVLMGQATQGGTSGGQFAGMGGGSFGGYGGSFDSGMGTSGLGGFGTSGFGGNSVGTSGFGGNSVGTSGFGGSSVGTSGFGGSSVGTSGFGGSSFGNSGLGSTSTGSTVFRPTLRR